MESHEIRPPVPLALQQRPDQQIHPAVIDPFSVARNSLIFEAEAPRDGAAFGISGAALDDNAVQAQLMKEVIQQYDAALGNDPFPLISRRDPIPDVAIAILPVDWMTSYCPGKFSVDPQPGLRPLVGFVLASHARDELADIFGRAGMVHPGEPLAQILAPAIHLGIDSFGVLKLEQPDFNSRRYRSAKHK